MSDVTTVKTVHNR